MQKSGWMWVSIGLIVVVVLTSYFGAYYYMETTKYQQLYLDTLTSLEKYESYMLVNVLIDFGNGTQIWHNNTIVPIGCNVLSATIVVAKVNYTLGQWGAFVTHINGAGGESDTYWVYNIWNSTKMSWDMGLVASDVYILHNGDTFNWIYQKF